MKALVDSLGNVAESYMYDAFGNLLERTSGGENSSFTNDILYAGEQYDEVTETYYLRARNYSPAEGRFINKNLPGNVNGGYDYSSGISGLNAVFAKL